MNYLEPFKLNEIDFEQIVYKKIDENKNKKIIFIKYNDNNVLKNFVFQLPPLNNYNLNFDFPLECNNNNKSEVLFDFINKLDNKILTDAKNKSSSWFNHINDKNKIKFQKTIHDSNEYKNGVLKLKNIISDEFSTQLLLNDEITIDINSIPTNGTCKIVLECFAVWIDNNTFGLLLRPIIISYKAKCNYNYNYNILYESDEDEDENENDDDNDYEINENSDDDNRSSSLFIKNGLNIIDLKINNNTTTSNSSIDL